MSRTLELFEHERLAVGQGIAQHEFDALVRFNDRHGGRYFEVGHKHLKTRSFVGYVEVGDLAIEILPKADKASPGSAKVWRAGLLEMLHVALGLRVEQVPDADQQLSRRRLLDLIARTYLAEVEQLLREGLAKGYRTTESNGGVFRGRLQMASHLRENIARADRFYVSYQTFDHDIIVNQLLAAALDALSGCALSSSIASSVEECLARFPDVRIAGVSAAMFDRVQLARSTQRYSKALTYARMILAQQGPKLQSGPDRVFALLFDMNALWERYIATLLKRAAPPGVRVSTQERHVFWAPQDRAARRVRPDIVVRSAALVTLLVIDTKWKVPSTGLPSDEDLKQMFVYNELLTGARSLLLYPRSPTSYPVSGAYATKHHTCAQLHLGVFDRGTWSSSVIKSELAHLLSTLT